MTSGWIQDIRNAGRMMPRTPIFILAVVLTVALSIAANTSLFSFLNSELPHPSPFRDPNRVLQKLL